MLKKILLSIAVIFIGVTIVSATPVFADCVKTSILGNGQEVCDDGSGSSIIDILKLVVNIMTVGIGVLGAIGITISGIQYLTAGGNEDQTRKAKRRIFEIVIGLAAYVLIYALLYWLLPGFKGV